MPEVTQARLRAAAVVSPVLVMLANQLTGLIEAPILVDMARGLDLDAPGASTAYLLANSLFFLPIAYQMWGDSAKLAPSR